METKLEGITAKALKEPDARIKIAQNELRKFSK